MSLTIISLLVLILNNLARWAELEVEFVESEVQAAVQALISFFSILGIWYGRVRKGDVTWYGVRLED